jgi:hypothetical protein
MKRPLSAQTAFAEAASKASRLLYYPTAHRRLLWSPLIRTGIIARTELVSVVPRYQPIRLLPAVNMSAVRNAPVRTSRHAMGVSGKTL